MLNLPDTTCYLNGVYQPLNEAKVSVLDRGFIFGDGIYEVVPVYGRRLFRFAEHMARLDRSLGKLRIPNPHSRDEWLGRCRKLVDLLAESQGAEDQLVYIQLTRGVALRDHVMPPDVVPTSMATPVICCARANTWSKPSSGAAVAAAGTCAISRRARSRSARPRRAGP